MFLNDSQPKISIVIAAWNGASYLRECLLSLEKQIKSDSEIIVVSNFEEGITKIQQRFSYVKIFVLEPETTVPQLFTDGIKKAKNSIIVLTEDFSIFDENWCQEIEKSHQLPFDVIGGSIENASLKNRLDWAVYFFDYSKYMSPHKTLISDTLSELNISYKKDVLVELSDCYEQGFHTNFINDELKKKGYELYLAPSAIVYHKKHYSFPKIINQYFHQARSYAAQRVLKFSFLKRSIFLLGSLILPILLPNRTIVRVLKKQNHFVELLMSFPILIVLTSIWAIGEFCGYLMGEGKSREAWR